MKKKILYTLVSTGVLLLAGCNESWNPGVDGEGTIVPVVDLDTKTVSSRGDKGMSRSDARAITVSDLNLTLTSTSTGEVRTWNSVDQFNVGEKFNVGAYTLEAGYGTRGEEGFDKPYYYGVTSLTVSENKTTTVALTAMLANSMITITYTDAFVNYFGDYSVDVRSLSGKTPISYSRMETRPVYVNAGNVELGVNVVKPNGSSMTIPVSVVAKAKYHHHVTLDVNGGNVGDAILSIEFDDTMETENITIDLSQDLENIPAPTVTAEGFTGAPIDIVAGTEVENPLVCTVMARGGIARAVLETQSTALTEMGWPATVDLMATPAATRTTMNALGFAETGMWNNPDQMAVIDLTRVIPNIPYKEGVSNRATFSLTVTDRLSQVSDVVTLTVNVEKLVVDIMSSETLPCYESRATFELVYNGTDPEGRLSVQYLNSAGGWTDADIESVTPKSRSAQNYVVVVAGLPDDAANGEKDVRLRVIAKNDRGEELQRSAEYVVKRFQVPFSLAVNDNDVYALLASCTVSHDEMPATEFLALNPVLEMSTDGGLNYSEYNYVVESDRLKIEGLKSSVTYTARLKYDGMNCRPVNFSTEAELQLPNAGMEEWSTAPGSSNHQTWHYPWSDGSSMVWNTYNPVTMSQGNSKYGYNGTSGTVYTGDVKSGSKAAQIRTVGWGSGNTASANAFNRWAFGTCKYVSAGQLFLGNWDGVEAIREATPNYGMNFMSRPSSVSFWYKYAVMNRNGNDNGQKGVAIVKIIDAQNAVVAEQEIQLDPNAKYKDVGANTDYSVDGTYVEKTISLNYPASASKAAKIVVIFKSSQLSGDELENRKNQDNMRPPKPMNLSNHEYLGSSLLIDDITLNY